MPWKIKLRHSCFENLQSKLSAAPRYDRLYERNSAGLPITLKMLLKSSSLYLTTLVEPTVVTERFSLQCDMLILSISENWMVPMYPFLGNRSEDVYSMYGRNKRIRFSPKYFRELNGADVPFSGNWRCLLNHTDATKTLRSIPDRLVLPYESWQVQFFDGSSKKKLYFNKLLWNWKQSTCDCATIWWLEFIRDVGQILVDP